MLLVKYSVMVISKADCCYKRRTSSCQLNTEWFLAKAFAFCQWFGVSSLVSFGLHLFQNWCKSKTASEQWGFHITDFLWDEIYWWHHVYLSLNLKRHPVLFVDCMILHLRTSRYLGHRATIWCKASIWNLKAGKTPLGHFCIKINYKILWEYRKLLRRSFFFLVMWLIHLFMPDKGLTNAANFFGIYLNTMYVED